MQFRNLAAIIMLSPLLCQAAYEINLDLGPVEAPPCQTTEWTTGSQSGLPAQRNSYSPRSTRLIARIISLDSQKAGNSGLQRCAADAQAKLNSARSVQNISLFAELFEKYMQVCLRATSDSPPAIRVSVDYLENCESGSSLVNQRGDLFRVVASDRCAASHWTRVDKDGLLEIGLLATTTSRAPQLAVVLFRKRDSPDVSFQTETPVNAIVGQTVPLTSIRGRPLAIRVLSVFECSASYTLTTN